MSKEQNLGPENFIAKKVKLNGRHLNTRAALGKAFRVVATVTTFAAGAVGTSACNSKGGRIQEILNQSYGPMVRTGKDVVDRIANPLEHMPSPKRSVRAATYQESLQALDEASK